MNYLIEAASRIYLCAAVAGGEAGIGGGPIEQESADNCLFQSSTKALSDKSSCSSHVCICYLMRNLLLFCWVCVHLLRSLLDGRVAGSTPENAV